MRSLLFALDAAFSGASVFDVAVGATSLGSVGFLATCGDGVDWAGGLAAFVLALVAGGEKTVC